MVICYRIGRSAYGTAYRCRWSVTASCAATSSTIPKRANRNRYGRAIFDFALSDEDMAKLDALNQNKRFGADPDNLYF